MKKIQLILLIILKAFATQAKTVWNNVQIGGAGFVSGIIYSKTKANLKHTSYSLSCFGLSYS